MIQVTLQINVKHNCTSRNSRFLMLSKQYELKTMKRTDGNSCRTNTFTSFAKSCLRSALSFISFNIFIFIFSFHHNVLTQNASDLPRPRIYYHTHSCTECEDEHNEFGASFLDTDICLIRFLSKGPTNIMKRNVEINIKIRFLRKRE